ncbi:hypothetical protein M0805_005361 [Coniferiporia weirii]|nr:hypothetical protein M0805_005361 [Coniferiporia weirii]
MSATDVSSKIGEYMLKGWVLTDDICPKQCSVPLMRSPRGRVPVTVFCASCDDEFQIQRVTSVTQPQPPPPRQSSPSVTHSSITHLSGVSTPATDISRAPSPQPFLLPADTAESIRRRQQSDAASAEIGKRLLKGWTMLADECPGQGCYGIPLVSPPLKGGKDTRKECVVCNTVYINEKDAAGWNQLAAEQDFHPAAASHPSGTADTSGGDSQLHYQISPQEKGKGRATESIPFGVEVLAGTTSEPVRKDRLNNPLMSTIHPSVRALEAATTSLEFALRSLSERLASLSDAPAILDPSAIGRTADAVRKVLRALVQAEELSGMTGP